MIAAAIENTDQDILVDVTSRIRDAEILEADADGLITVHYRPAMQTEGKPETEGRLSIVTPSDDDEESVMAIVHGDEPLETQVVNEHLRVADFYRHRAEELAKRFRLPLDEME